MNNQEDFDSINDELYSYDVPNEPIKKIMFYFMVLKEVIDFPFPDNYMNYEHPYFNSYEQMEEFFALSRSLNPDFLQQNNVIIYHNDKNYYKYYQLNDDQNGISYEFKVVDINESKNPIFNDNYQNAFNISNIDKNQIEFEIKVPNRSRSLHSDENSDYSIEENYFSNDKKSHNFKLSNNKKNKNRDSMKEKKRKKNSNKKNKHKNLMISENELDNNSSEEFHSEKVKIKHRLIVTKDWIDFIYNETQRELLQNMKIAIKKDEIRTKSIKLPKNAFFYLEIFMLVVLCVCSWTLFSMASSLKSDERFHAYNGQNITQNSQSNEAENLYQFGFDFDVNSKLLDDEKIDYSNDTFIIPEINKYKKINKACQLSITSAIFANLFLIFIIYMSIRISREKRKKYQNKEKAKKAGLNICHFIVFIFLTLLAFILTMVAEIYICIAISQQTYNFIHDMVRNQLIVNSLLFVCYILIILFYCKI